MPDNENNKPRTSFLEYIEKGIRSFADRPIVNEGRFSARGEPGGDAVAGGWRERMKQVLENEQTDPKDVLKSLSHESLQSIGEKLEGKTPAGAFRNADLFGKLGLAGAAGLTGLGVKDILSEDKHDKRHVFRGVTRIGLGFGFAAFAAATGHEWGASLRSWADRVTQPNSPDAGPQR